MATIAVAGVGYAAVAAAGPAAPLVAAAVAAAAIGAAYIDQRYVYPSLFGRDRPQQPNTLGIDQMTGEDGSPGHTSWGAIALVGGHVLFFENVEELNVSQGNKKGTTSASFKRRIADVGIGWTRNLIANVEQINADQKVFWRRSPNNVVWTDYRATVTTASSGTRMRITPTIGDVQDFAQIFTVGDVVNVSGLIGAPNGYWRVAAVLGIGSSGATNGQLELLPLANQTPTAGTAGTGASPLMIRRLDAAILDHLIVWSVVGPALICDVLENPSVAQASHFWRSLYLTMTPGRAFLFENFANAINGRWTLWATNFFSGTGTRLVFHPLDGQTIAIPSHTSATNVGRVLLNGEDGFLEPSQDQSIVHYLGTESQGEDVDLLGVYGAGNVHGYRGLARSTIRKLGMTNWGDRVPQFSGIVKTSDGHTTHNVLRDLMREAFRGDDLRYDLSLLEPNQLLGYTRRGRQTTTTTIQPVAIAYGIEAQERGDVWTFFKAAQADLHVIAETELGAHVGRSTRSPGRFDHQRLQETTLPRRLSLFYRDPLNDFARSEKLVRASSPDDQQDEGVVVDVDPVVLYPWDAQAVVNRLYNNAVTGRDQGKVMLPPSRIDVLPNDRLTYTALNWNEEEVVLVAGAIDHTTQIGEVEPFSVSIEVEFETSGRCRLVDDGNGDLVGMPAGVTASTNTVNYATGAIDFVASEDILDGRIRYEFPNGWRMRAQRVTRRVNHVIEVDVVAVADSLAVVGSPVQQNDPAYAVVVHPAQLRSEVLDIPAVSSFSGHAEIPGVFYAACPLPGSQWRGAGVYSSTDGTSYTLRATIANPSTMGTAESVLATGSRYVVDWINTVDVHLDYGTLTNATIEQMASGFARNWILIGDEVLAFHEATYDDDTDLWTLSGLLRGLRDTDDKMGTHATGERVVLLDQLGTDGTPNAHGTFEMLLQPGELGQSRWFKIVPAGGILDSSTAVQVTLRANNVRSFAPDGVVQGSLVTYGYEWDTSNSTYDPDEFTVADVSIRWFRRSRAIMAAFGAGSSAPLLEPLERYEVEILRNAVVLPSRTTIVGGANTATQLVHRTFRYTLAEQTADALTGGDVVAMKVRQIGTGGVNGYSRAAEISWTLA